MELGFPATYILDLYVVEKAVGYGVDDCNLLGHGERCILALLQDFLNAQTAVELCARGFVEVGAELGEGREVAELGHVELEATGNLAIGLDLSVATNTANGDTDVD